MKLGSDPIEPGPFGAVALDLFERGLVVLPTGKADRKSPLVRHWELRKARKTIEKWSHHHANANIAVAAGASGFVVVDVDYCAGEPLDIAFKTFGATPVVVRTPGGGLHLWYKKVGKVRGGPFELPGLKGDIKADGGYVVVPPSYNPAKHGAYSFLRGSWNHLTALPAFQDPRPLKAARGVQVKARPIADAARDGKGPKVLEGQRNNTLFRFGLSVAHLVSSKEDLGARLQAHNATVMTPPLPDHEVSTVCDSIWNMKSQGRLWSSGSAFLKVTDAHLSLLKLQHGDEALVLLLVLERAHAVREEPFAISSEAMSRNSVIADWGPKIYTRARKILVQEGWIVPVSKAVRLPSGLVAAAKYKLAKSASVLADNITYTPLPSSLPVELENLRDESARIPLADASNCGSEDHRKAPTHQCGMWPFAKRNLLKDVGMWKLTPRRLLCPSNLTF